MRAELNGLNTRVVNLLIEKNLKISSAESCTGGLFSTLITDVPGSSQIMDECIVTYANSAKMSELGVKKETLEKYGAVSRQTAYEMAKGICAHTGADIGVGITGIAGPGGGSAEKPVGTVFAGINVKGEITVEEYHIDADRAGVREETCRRVFSRTEKLIKNI